MYSDLSVEMARSGSGRPRIDQLVRGEIGRRGPMSGFGNLLVTFHPIDSYRWRNGVSPNANERTNRMFRSLAAVRPMTTGQSSCQRDSHTGQINLVWHHWSGEACILFPLGFPMDN